MIHRDVLQGSKVKKGGFSFGRDIDAQSDYDFDVGELWLGSGTGGGK